MNKTREELNKLIRFHQGNMEEYKILIKMSRNRIGEIQELINNLK